MNASPDNVHRRIAQSRGMRPHQRSQCCGHDRNPGCLHRRRVHDRSNRRVILSLIRRHLLAEELTHDFDVLAKPGNSLRVLPVRQTDHLSPRLSRQAGTQSQIQSPIGHLIHSDCLMSQDPWIPQRNLCHVAGKTNCRRLDRRRSEKCPALHPRRQGGVAQSQNWSGTAATSKPSSFIRSS